MLVENEAILCNKSKWYNDKYYYRFLADLILPYSGIMLLLKSDPRRISPYTKKATNITTSESAATVASLKKSVSVKLSDRIL